METHPRWTPEDARDGGLTGTRFSPDDDHYRCLACGSILLPEGNENDEEST